LTTTPSVKTEMRTRGNDPSQSLDLFTESRRGNNVKDRVAVAMLASDNDKRIIRNQARRGRSGLVQKGSSHVCSTQIQTEVRPSPR